MTPRQLGVLAGLVLVLAGIVVVDRPRLAVGTDTRVFGVRADAISRVELTGVGAGAVLVRGADGAITLDGGGAVDPDVVADVLSAIESLAERGRVAAADEAGRGLGAGAARVAVTAGGATIAVTIGGASADGRRWVASSAASGVDLVVDEHQVRALLVDREALRRRRAFLAPEVGAITLGDVVIDAAAGSAPRCVRVGGGCARADAAQVDALVGRLAAIRIAGAPGDVGAPRLTVRAGDEALLVGAECPGDPGARRASGVPGSGCVPAEDVHALEVLAADPLALVDRAPWRRREDASAIAIDEGARRLAIALAHEAATGPEGPMDRGAVDGWLAGLGAVRARAVVAADGSPARATLTIVSPRGGDVLELHGAVPGGGVRVRRAGEPVDLIVPDDAARFFAADPAPFGDPTLLSFEASSVRSIETDVEAVRRGATLDDWSMARPVHGAVDGDARTHLVDAGAQLTAVRILPRATRSLGAAPDGRARTITFVLDPAPTAPAGAAPERRTVELGGPAPGGGCLARVAGKDGVLGEDDCDALRAHLADPASLVPGADAELLGVEVDGVRWDRGAGRWLSEGLTVDERTAARLDLLVEGLLAPDETVGYGRATGHAVTLELAGPRRVALTVGRGEASPAAGGVRVALPLALCERWAALCR